MVDTDLIQKLLTLMDEGGLTELVYEQGDTKIKLSRQQDGAQPLLLQGGGGMAAYPGPGFGGATAGHPGAAAYPGVADAGGPGTAAGGPPPAPPEEDLAVFRSPMVGTLYRRPNPESEPFCSAGDVVHGDSVLCIIEAMKVFNEIKAEMRGEIVEVLAQDGDTVQFDQPLFKLRTT